MTTTRSLTIGLLRAREAVMSHFRPILATHNVTEQQWRVIRVLSESGMLDASELAVRASVLAPSLTRMIRLLDERGLVEKHRDGADGRRMLLRITATGQKVIDEIMPQSLKVYEEIGDRFGAARVQQLLDMLDDLTALSIGNSNCEIESSDNGD